MTISTIGTMAMTVSRIIKIWPNTLKILSSLVFRDTIYGLLIPSLLMNAFNILLMKSYFVTGALPTWLAFCVSALMFCIRRFSRFWIL